MPRAARGINVPREDLGLKVNRWLQRLDGWISYTWLLFPIAGLFVTWEVAMRYFFDSPHSWYEEISIFLLVFVTDQSARFPTLAFPIAILMLLGVVVWGVAVIVQSRPHNPSSSDSYLDRIRKL